MANQQAAEISEIKARIGVLEEQVAKLLEVAQGLMPKGESEKPAGQAAASEAGA